nr:DapH/DapD/GlmU-related protein [Candidatus Sigynarchaeota archaeon]
MEPEKSGQQQQSPINEQHVTLSPPLVATHSKWLIFIFYLSTMATVALAWSYYNLVVLSWLFLFLFPFEMAGLAYVFILSSLFLVKIAVTILEKKCKPNEGVFPRDSREMRYYQARSYFKYYAIWLTRNSTFPWVDKIAYKLLGVHVGKTVVLHEAWVDSEFVDVKDYCMIGMNSTVMSHCLYHDVFLTRKTVIDENSIIGAYSVIAPGTKVGRSCVIGANSGTNLNGDVECGYLFGGNPVKKLKKIE